MNQTTIDYAFRTQLILPHEQAVEKVTAALIEQGFIESLDI